MQFQPVLILCAFIGYILGSLSTGVIYSRHLGRDVRTRGSKNSGASNMMRVHGVRPGVLTFIGDCAKAIVSIALGYWLCGHDGAMVAGFFVILGHNWPVFFGFKGGKGVACSTAVYILNFPALGIISVVACVATIFATKYISLGSLVMSALFLVLMLIFEPFIPAGLWALVLAVLAFARHHGNIQRLLNGTERKIGQREK